MMRRVTILFIDTAPKLAGGQVSLLALLSGLDKERYLPLLAVPPGSGLELRGRELGVHTLPFPLASRTAQRTGSRRGRYRGWPWEPWRLARAVTLGKRWCRAHGVRLLHANTTKAGVAAVLVGRMTGIPVVFHHRLEGRGGPVAGLALGGSSRVVCVSQATEASLALPEAKTRVVYDGVDVRAFAEESGAGPANRGRDSGLGREEAPTVAVIGRLSHVKGQDLFLAAARQVVRDHPQVRFLLAGEAYLPPDIAFERRLRRLAESTELGGRVHFLGFYPDVPELLRRVDVLVAPSRRESLGIAVLEAMAAGCPVVAVSRGGLRETVSDGETGLLVPPEDPSSMARAISSLLGDHDRRREMGRRGRERVRAKFSLEAMVEGLDAVYRELLGN